MSSTVGDPTTTAARPRRRTPVVVTVVCLLAVMAWVWWYFLALREEQGYRVLFSAGAFSGQAAALGDSPAAGARLRTGDDGYATVRLSDGSIVKLMPGTALDIVDARASADGQRFRTGLRLLSGEIESEIPRADGRQREVSLFSNSVAIGVRGTIFTVREEGDRARVMVTRGAVEARGGAGAAVPVAADQGTVVNAGEAPQPVSVLPPPPRVTEAAVVGVDGVRLRWAATPPQPGYLLEIAEDRAFQRLLRRERVAWEAGTVAPLARDGDYFWRVASVDARELRGRYSEPHPFAHTVFLERARGALQGLDPGAVLAHLANAASGLEEEVARLRARGMRLLGGGDHAAARPLLETVLALRPEDREVANALAVADYHLMDYDSARARFAEGALRAPSSAPGEAEARVGLALIDVRQGRFDEGLEGANAVLAADPRHLAALQVAAMASVGLGRRDEALEFVRRALAVNPDDVTAQALRETLAAPGQPALPELPSPGAGG